MGPGAAALADAISSTQTQVQQAHICGQHTQESARVTRADIRFRDRKRLREACLRPQALGWAMTSSKLAVLSSLAELRLVRSSLPSTSISRRHPEGSRDSSASHHSIDGTLYMILWLDMA